MDGTTTPVLIDRAAESAALTDVARRASHGHGRVVVLTGEPGIGKTELLTELARRCSALGFRIRRGAAEELARRLRFSAMASCLELDNDEPLGDPARQALVREMLSSDKNAPYEELAVAEAILALVEDACASGPLMLGLDDVQWADDSTALMLHRLGVVCAQLPLVVALTVRPTPRTPAVERLLRSLARRGALDLAVRPISPEAVAELAADQLGAAPGPSLLELLKGAAGNPLYVTEFLEALQRDGSIAVTNGVAEAPTLAAHPPTLTATILRRLDFLAPATRSMLRTASMLGAGFSMSDLAVVMAQPVTSLVPLVGEARDSGVLRIDGHGFGFRHEMVRAALADDAEPAVRSEVHVRAAQALAAAGARVERVAEHLLAADTLDDELTAWLVRSASALTARAPSMAVALLRRALAAVGEVSSPGEDSPASGSANGPAPSTLRLELVRALLFCDPAGAEREALEWLGTPTDGESDAQLRWLLVQAYFQQGKFRESAAEAERALAAGTLGVADAARFSASLGHSLSVLGDLDRAQDAAERAVALGTEAADGYGVTYGLTVLSGVKLQGGRTMQALELVDQVVGALGRHETRADPQMAVLLTRGTALLELDRFSAADRDFETGLTEMELGGWFLVPAHHLGRAMLRYYDGRWDDGLAEIDAGLAIGGETSAAADDTSVSAALHDLRALIGVHRGDLGQSSTATLRPAFEAREHPHGHVGVWARALAVESLGNSEDALRILSAGWVSAARPGEAWSRLFLGPDLVRLAVDAGDDDILAAVLRELDGPPVSHSTPTVRALTRLCRGLARGDAASQVAAAIELRAAGRPLFHAYAAENAAVLLGLAGHTEEARAWGAEALESYGRLGASWESTRTEGQLRTLGLRVAAKTVKRRARSGWDALTDTELRVLEQVAAGQSNPDIAAAMFLSRRTVASHVSSILAKLALTSRIELAVAVRQHGLTPQH